jgi:glycosyltransferase involved in cell wall biosynthesis
LKILVDKKDPKNRIRILRIINRFNLGGPTYNAVFLTRYLSDEFETLLVGGMPEEGEIDSLHILQEYGVEPVLLREMKRTPGILSDRAAYRELKRIIREFDPQIVHTHASKAGALGRRAAFKMKVPVVIHTFHGHVFHSYFGKIKTFLYKSIERSLAKRSSGIIAISELQKRELSDDHKICAKEHIQVVPLGFDLLRFKESREKYRSLARAEFDISDHTVAVALIGRVVPVKNHQMFLDVVEQVSRKIDVPVKFFIVGDGTEKKALEERIEKMKLPRHVQIIMTSWILDIAKFNAGMDVICLTSLNEGTPVSLIEAQASGIPVVATDVGGVRDVVNDGKTGFVVPSLDVGKFSEKLLFLLQNKKTREEMSQNGWTFVEDKFHYTRLVKNMETYYKKLLAACE